MARKPRKKKPATPVQPPIKSFVSLRDIKPGDSRWDLDAAARTAYESFVREAGYEKDARIQDWDKLKVRHHARWRTIAQNVIDAATGTTRKEPA